ncbi:hypothetical protein FV226_11565 [Methylobacterium sp. WL12]|uniref:hypothetical protein n=1 Tax=Methylobacterium sp. WL12 TaxID=2603890 RepID=UPI0011CAE47B|nr:hypothetical protein [Methylobacterium sp. WL12]TXM72655.1 hypothetical protein FV226_11565 [Methylobacterium sp. WL12]
MTYSLHHLAPGSYDLVLNGAIVGGVVREVTASGSVRGWCAELFDDLPEGTRPRPFDCVEHRFPTLEAAAEWLGGAQILDALEDA